MTFMDSTCLRVLVETTMAVQDRDGGKLAVRNVSGQVSDLFTLTGVDNAIDII